MTSLRGDQEIRLVIRTENHLNDDHDYDDDDQEIRWVIRTKYHHNNGHHNDDQDDESGTERE